MLNTNMQRSLVCAHDPRIIIIIIIYSMYMCVVYGLSRVGGRGVYEILYYNIRLGGGEGVCVREGHKGYTPHSPINTPL